MPAPASASAFVVIPITCGHCGQAIDVDCVHTSGFSVLKFYTLDCPACDKNTLHQLPGDILDVWKRGERPSE